MTRLRHPFKQVDVFGAAPFSGNPVAVVFRAEALDTAEMQRIAAWTNLSETTFVLPPSAPGADYQLRIFDPTHELPFAGHPTLGSAHAVIEAGLCAPHDGRLVQQCQKGLLTVRVDERERLLWVTVPRPQCSAFPLERIGELAQALGREPLGPPLVVEVGPTWLIAELADAAVVQALVPDMSAIVALSKTLALEGVTVFGRLPKGSSERLTVRSFSPRTGVPEDPVCGSGNAAVGVYVSTRESDAPRQYVARQGQALGRDGRVHVRLIGEPNDGTHDVEIGGTTVTRVDGVLET